MRRFGGLFGSLCVLLTLAGCMYGFAGGGLPPNIGTMAIAPFDNQTDIAGSPQGALRSDARRAAESGLASAMRRRSAPMRWRRERFVSYDADIPVSFSANPQQAVTARRRLQVTIEVEIIDQSNGHVLYQNKSLREEADYAERAEADGRKQAIAKLVQKIIEGVQSNW